MGGICLLGCWLLSLFVVGAVFEGCFCLFVCLLLFLLLFFGLLFCVFFYYLFGCFVGFAGFMG